MYVEVHLLIIISWLLQSVCSCPKVIPLSDFSCRNNCWPVFPPSTRWQLAAVLPRRFGSWLRNVCPMRSAHDRSGYSPSSARLKKIIEKYILHTFLLTNSASLLFLNELFFSNIVSKWKLSTKSVSDVKQKFNIKTG